MDRLDLKEVVIGGVSDPRNTTLMKMFNLIDVGERAGSGIPNIFKVWEEQQWALPVIEEKFNPERSILYLYLTKFADKKSAEKIGGKNRRKKSAEKISDKRKKQILEYLSTIESATSIDVAKAIDLGISRTKDYLLELVNEDRVICEGKTKNRVYKINY